MRPGQSVAVNNKEPLDGTARCRCEMWGGCLNICTIALLKQQLLIVSDVSCMVEEDGMLKTNFHVQVYAAVFATSGGWNEWKSRLRAYDNRRQDVPPLDRGMN